MRLAVARDIPIELEITPERFELRTVGTDMAGRARLPGLRAKARHCPRRGRTDQHNTQHAQDNPEHALGGGHEQQRLKHAVDPYATDR